MIIRRTVRLRACARIRPATLYSIRTPLVLRNTGGPLFASRPIGAVAAVVLVHNSRFAARTNKTIRKGRGAARST